MSILLIAAGPNLHTPALQRAFDLARAAEVPVHVCLFAYDALIERSGTLIDPEVRRLSQHQFLDEQRQWIERLVAGWKADGLAASGEVAWAPRPHEAILAKVQELRPALVIKDVGNAPLLRRLSFTALDWQLVRKCPAPLMLVHGLSTHPPRRILAAVDTAPDARDPGPVNDLILREALKLADWTDADAHVAHVFPFLPLPVAAVRSLDALYADSRAADRETFRTFAESHQVPSEARHWLEGDPVQRLVDVVKEQSIDLLVLGSCHRSALDRLLLGSTAETLLLQLPCDMLLVKPPALAKAQDRQAA